MIDMGARPMDTSLDRIDSDGHYTPQNCRWANRMVQGRNRRNVLSVAWKGEIVKLIDLCENLGVEYKRARDLVKKGHTVEEAICL